MEFNEYQKKAHKTAQYPHIIIDGKDEPCLASYIYPVLGLMGEAGEVSEKIKKLVRNHNGFYCLNDVKEIEKELGDVLWYLAEICSAFDISLNDVASLNLDKLADRAKRDVIKSEGDNR